MSEPEPADVSNVKATPTQVAMIDQADAAVSAILKEIEIHRPVCQVGEEYCVGKTATRLVFEFAGGDTYKTRALIFMSLIRAAKYRRSIGEALDLVKLEEAKHEREEGTSTA